MVLQEWSAPGLLGAGELLSALRPLQPRLYSISSSQRENPRSVQATVSSGEDRECGTWGFRAQRSSLGKDCLGKISFGNDSLGCTC